MFGNDFVDLEVLGSKRSPRDQISRRFGKQIYDLGCRKLVPLGFSHLVECWELPARLEWALASERGAEGYQTGSFA